jgi:hypothetical protein
MSCLTSTRNRKKTNHCFFYLAPHRGLPSQCLSTLLVRSYRTFAPLPNHSEFQRIRAVFFCGTILTIARTGRYPAGVVFREPGLSSDRSLQPPAPPLSFLQSSGWETAESFNFRGFGDSAQISVFAVQRSSFWVLNSAF